MAVASRDRAYFERIGAIKEALHGEAARTHASLPLSDRLANSWNLYLSHRTEVDLTKRDDDPSPFYERARQLGLYEG